MWLLAQAVAAHLEATLPNDLEVEVERLLREHSLELLRAAAHFADPPAPPAEELWEDALFEALWLNRPDAQGR